MTIRLSGRPVLVRHSLRQEGVLDIPLVAPDTATLIVHGSKTPADRGRMRTFSRLAPRAPVLASEFREETRD
jgi:hypothetical protein